VYDLVYVCMTECMTVYMTEYMTAFSSFHHVKGFFIRYLETVASNETTIIISCHPQSQILSYEYLFQRGEVMETQFMTCCMFV